MSALSPDHKCLIRILVDLWSNSIAAVRQAWPKNAFPSKRNEAMFPFLRFPFRRESLDYPRLVFKGINFVGWVMVGLVFLCALFVSGVCLGYIPLNFGHKIRTDVLNMLKYTLLSVSLLLYLLIRLFKYFIAWLFNKRYLNSADSLVFASLIIFGLCEAVNIYGLVVFLLSRNPADFFVFMAISLFYFYSFYPKYEDWDRLLNQEFKAAPSHS